MNNTVFITGIEGFVGSQLARHLHEHGQEVAGIHLADPVSDLSFARVRRCDVRAAPELRAFLTEVEPGFIIHLAAISSVSISEQHPDLALQVNVLGTAQLLESVRVLGLRSRVIFVSSADVYDKPANGSRPLTEDSPLRPISAYALTKVCCENVARYYADRHDLDVVILRSFSHAGPGQGLSFVFPSVAHQIAEAEIGRRGPEIEVGNTDVSRDYTDIRDACRAYRLALTMAVRGEVYNVTSEHLLRIGEGIDYLVSLARVPVTVRSVPGRVRQENTVLHGSAARFRAATGWRPEFDIRQTLLDLLDFERGRLASE